MEDNFFERIKLTPLLESLCRQDRREGTEVSLINLKTYVLLFSFLLFFSCKKENKIQLSWTTLNSPTSMTLNSISFINDSIGYAVGGDLWVDDIVLTTKDGGQSWSADSIGGKELYAINFDKNNNGFTGGINGQFHFKAAQQDNWESFYLGFGYNVRDIAFWNKDNGIIVTGGAFQGGMIFKFSEGFNFEVVDSFEQGLSSIFYSDENTIHVGGYGLILRSTDGGDTWKRTGITADYFRSIHFPTSQVGYAIGYSGSIVKTNNAGQDWATLRNGDKLNVSNEPFRSVFFVDENEGYIVGDFGLFWKTADGGNHWDVVDFPNDIDLHDVFAINNRIYIVGEKGVIFLIEL